MEPILPGAPWLIAHKSMLGVNQPKKITLNSQDYVLWQNYNGEVFALDNVCPHMQAPLSNGWVCQERNTITCPFHALEFDGQGRYKEGKQNTQSLIKPLELFVVGDCIWTYGIEPKAPIPDLIPKITAGFEFIGVTGEKSIQSNFLSNLLLNYDFNHQNGTHRDLFKIKANKIISFEHDRNYAKVEQEFIRDENALGEILSNPSLLFMPKTYPSYLEYSFPSTTAFLAKVPTGEFMEIHLLYPETENRTKTFVLTYAKFKNPLLKLLKQSFLKAVATVVEQDSTMAESLYPRQEPKIRLPNEEIMFYAEKLYRDW